MQRNAAAGVDGDDDFAEVSAAEVGTLEFAEVCVAEVSTLDPTKVIGAEAGTLELNYRSRNRWRDGSTSAVKLVAGAPN